VFAYGVQQWSVGWRPASASAAAVRRLALAANFRRTGTDGQLQRLSFASVRGAEYFITYASFLTKMKKIITMHQILPSSATNYFIIMVHDKNHFTL
jgi:hypothetical protein